MGFSSYIYSCFRPVYHFLGYFVSIEREIDISEAFTRIEQEAIYSDLIDRKEFWGRFSREPISSPAPSIQKAVSLFEKEGIRKKIALDLGCGKTASTLFLLQKGWKVIAVDYSQEALDNLQAVANRINPDWILTGQLSLVCEDIENYRLPPNITLIVASRILPYLDPRKIRVLWDSLYDSLAPGGRIVGTFYPRRVSRSIFELGQRALMGKWFTDMASVQALLASKGYQIETCGYNNFWFSSLRDIEFIGRKQEHPSSEPRPEGRGMIWKGLRTPPKCNFELPGPKGPGFPFLDQKGLFSIHLSSYFDAVKGLPAKGLFPHFIPFLADRLIELKEMSKLTTFASGAIALTQALFQYDTSLTPYIFAGSISAWFIFKKFTERMENKASAHIIKARTIDCRNYKALNDARQQIITMQETEALRLFQDDVEVGIDADDFQ